MRNAKFWSVLLAAVLLCACVAGVLFTGANASGSRVPAATETYVVGTDGDNIRACLEKATGETWGKDDVLKIQFSGADSSAYSKPDPANGISGYTLFEVSTIFREDNTKLPIIIEGTDSDRAALIKTQWNDYCATNDYFFVNLTMNGGVEGTTVKFYAGSGEIVFEECNFNNYLRTYYFGDNLSMDAYEGWDEAKVAANANEKGLLETGITFGHGCGDFYQGISSGDKTQRLSAVGYDGSDVSNPVILALKRAKDKVTVALTDDEVSAVKAAAPEATFKTGNVVTDCIVKPWDTAAHLVFDNNKVAKRSDYNYGFAGARKGVSPVREATVELQSGCIQYLSAGAHDSAVNETYVGDTNVIVRGGMTGSYDVGIRLTNVAMLVGNLTLEIHEDNPALPTQINWVQTSQGTTTSTVFGDYYFLMTGGTIGLGYSVAKVDAEGNQVVDKDGKPQWSYHDGNDGYWGAPLATGSIINEIRGGHLWSFYGSRYANSYENTPVSTTLPGTGETLTAKVTVRNVVSGGIFGGEKVTGPNAELDIQQSASTKAFYGQVKGSQKLASVCNEITGGTFYQFNAANSAISSTPGSIYNFVSGTEEKYPTFLTHFFGTGSTVTTDYVTNVFKGCPKFENEAGEKLSIFGACRQGTVDNVTTYLGGMPVFDDFYGGVSGAKPAAGKQDSDCEGLAGKIKLVVALDQTEKAISNYVWGGNGYHTVKGVNGAAESAGNSENRVTGSITVDIYSGHFGTFRAESACGKHDNVPITVNVYGGKWTSAYMPANRVGNKGTTALKDSVITNNIYDGDFYVCYMGGQNARNQEFVNNVYGGTFNGWYYGGGNVWAKKVTNNIYGGDFKAGFAGGGSACGFESLTNNIYGGVFNNGQNIMGAYSNPAAASNIYAEQTISNNFYGGEFLKWVYCGHRNGTTGTIENHFYTGEESPVRDPENELNKYQDQTGKTTEAGGSYFHDQVVCGSGYTESEIAGNKAESIVNTFEGGLWTKNAGGYTDITIHGGMRWGVVGNVTNNFISGHYYRYFAGCDYGRVTGTVTTNFGIELAEGAEAPILDFKGYVHGGGLDQADIGGKIETALSEAESDRSDAQKAWAKIAAEYGEDFEQGAEFIVNNVYYGTFHQFHGGSRGSDTASIVSDINTITNNVYGGIFAKLGGESSVYAGGCFRSAVIENGIVNNIDGGVFNGNYYGGSIGTGKVSCPSITNTVNGGSGNQSANAYVYFGNGAPEYNGVVKTVVNDFNAGKTYVMGGSTNVHNQPDGVEYGIETTINGGTFSGFWGLGGGGSCVYIGNVKTTVNGGVFNGYSSVMRNSIAGGARNAAITGDIELVINDGIFTADVVGGTIYGSYEACAKEIAGDVTLTVKGGDFQENLYAVCKTEGEITCSGTVSVNVEQTDTDLKLGGVSQITNFVSNGNVVEIDEETDITVGTLTGTLNLKQTKGWGAHDYLKLPAGSVYTIDESAATYGYIEKDETILVKGVGFEVSGVTIRLEEDLGLRFLFDADLVDSYGEAFKLKVLLGEEELAESTAADMEMYKGYKSLIVKGIGLTDFETVITLSGNAIYDKELTLVGLIETAKPLFTGEWAEVLGALENLHNVYNKEAVSDIRPEVVTDENKTTDGDAVEKVTAAAASLAMSDSIALEMVVELAEVPENFVLKVNGEVLEDYYTVTSGENAATVKISLPVKARFMEEMITVELSSDSGVYFTYEFSIAATAYALANNAENENAAKAAALLYYIQQAVDCVA